MLVEVTTLIAFYLENGFLFSKALFSSALPSLSSVIHHITKLKNENNMIISVDEEKLTEFRKMVPMNLFYSWQRSFRVQSTLLPYVLGQFWAKKPRAMG